MQTRWSRSGPIRDRIVQVLTNLLGNALLATGSGGTVTVAARSGPRGGEVSVTDTGVGLCGPDLERVFERFYRAPGQPRRSAGSGIGLTIAREIARGHGGNLTASSPVRGLGAVFHHDPPAPRVPGGFIPLDRRPRPERRPAPPPGSSAAAIGLGQPRVRTIPWPAAPTPGLRHRSPGRSCSPCSGRMLRIHRKRRRPHR